MYVYIYIYIYITTMRMSKHNVTSAVAIRSNRCPFNARGKLASKFDTDTTSRPNLTG